MEWNERPRIFSFHSSQSSRSNEVKTLPDGQFVEFLVRFGRGLPDGLGKFSEVS